MSLEYALLGFLNYKPLSGYDLKKLCDNSIRHFWPADQSQIYRTLSRLAEQNWVEMEIIEQTDRPDRKVYHITPSGRNELTHWLKGPVPPDDPRSAPLVQIFFSGQLSDDEILAKFQFAAAQLRTALERYQQVPLHLDDYIQTIDSPREMFCWMLTLESGLSMAKSQLAWVESVIERIQNKAIPEK